MRTVFKRSTHKAILIGSKIKSLAALPTSPVIWIAILFITLLPSISNATSACFEPSMDPVISKYLQPRATDHETLETIRQMEQMIYDSRELIDPRLVYHRIVGESRGIAEIHNRRSGAYGMFQFLGHPYGSHQSYESILRSLYAKSPGVSHRMIQLKYYLEVFVPKAAKAANQGNGCDRHKSFANYSNLEKVAYLGWGSCDAATLKREVSLSRRASSYREACTFSSAAIQGRAEPICYSASDERTAAPAPRAPAFNH